MLPPSITGDVVEVHARWTADGDRIVTESTIATADGPVVVSQLGGTVDGLTMRSWPAPELLAAGMRVTLAIHEGRDLAGHPHVAIDAAEILARPAQPDFVRTGPTKAGHYLYWESGCIFLTVDPAGTKAVPNAMLQPAIDASIATWNDDTAACSYIQVMEQPPPAGTTTLQVGNDGMNVLKFRDASWCRPMTADAMEACYPPAAAGITTAVFIDDATSKRDGAIVDADIEINGVNFAIAVGGVTASNQMCQAELQNTLTHEVGHLHGLEHTCRVDTDPPRVDNTGSAVPLCTATTDPEIQGATMYPFQVCGEMTKETLEDDDINAICAIYPTAADPHTCTAPAGSSSGGCCSATGSRGEAALLAAMVLVVGRRRRSAS